MHTAPQNAPLPYQFAKQHGIFLLPVTEGNMSSAHMALREGSSPLALIEARRVLEMPMICERLSDERFNQLLAQVYESKSSQNMQTIESMEQNIDLAHLVEKLPEQIDLLESNDAAPVIQLINALLTEAVKQRASDIHIEPTERQLNVRFRVDGIMRQAVSLKRTLAPLLVSRIKVMAKLDIAEKRTPQDGHIPLTMGGNDFDIRVSTIPSGGSERVVLRLLNKQSSKASLDHLGMSSRDLEVMKELIEYPQGVILVTGPTGAGKTTTLYAALSKLNNHERSILTIEDPIEISLEGIGQTEVNTKVEMTFARGLRAILRQDPDAIMVGEIRDPETARIAVQASMTGHLVLSTVHTNRAVGAVTRLHDMGIEPFLLSSSLVGLVSQRLARKLCPHCRQPHTAHIEAVEAPGLMQLNGQTIYKAQGCEECKRTGYHGRIGIYEVIRVDENLRALIHSNNGEHDYERYARQCGPGIIDDACQKILSGDTSVEEVLRILQA